MLNTTLVSPACAQHNDVHTNLTHLASLLCVSGTGIHLNRLWKPGDSERVRDLPVEKLTYLNKLAYAEDSESDSEVVARTQAHIQNDNSGK